MDTVEWIMRRTTNAFLTRVIAVVGGLGLGYLMYKFFFPMALQYLSDHIINAFSH
ncbi:hypothetical protein [Paenibacillus alba]|uniref:Uncharacterized protein n=1 Tax=Paenibacillus alba TaxID=1197127 RepID=A0ABU6GBI6_9BACL|nr:hypothetical protein [Paenibacillus alba]MEC0231301.1 hypothetical protein [Paenibacillus alba]